MKPKFFYLIITFCITICNIHAQNTFPSTGNAGIGTTTPNASALLDMESTTKGLLIPQMTTAQRNAITSPATGLLIYQTNGLKGFYYYDGSNWSAVAKGANTTLSNLKSPTAISVDVLPSADNTVNLGNGSLRYKSVNVYSANVYSLNVSSDANINGITVGAGGGGSNTDNTALGYDALSANTTGSSNIAIGVDALVVNTSGYQNSAMGAGTLYNNTTGNGNTAAGTSALYANTSGNQNNAIGDLALVNNTTGSFNTATGAQALLTNTTGAENTADGYSALFENTTGNYNTALGFYALYANKVGHDNTAAGFDALYFDSAGYNNTAMGETSLYHNYTGTNNTASGYSAMHENTTGSYNAAMGEVALYNNTSGNTNTAAGYNALVENTTGYSNVGIGTSALALNTTQSNLVAVGDSSLYNNNLGIDNAALGSKALYGNTTGSFNTANGWQALESNTTGEENTASGADALYSNTTGSFNTASGGGALYFNTGSDNTASGIDALGSNTTGRGNTASGEGALYSNTTGGENSSLGWDADVNAGNYLNTTVIGFSATGTASSQVRIGSSSVTSIGGYANWTNISDGRVKKNIQQNVPGLSFINQLQPVTYNLDLDAADRIIQHPVHKDKDGKTIQPSQEELTARTAKEKVVYTGFIAQDVEKAAKNLNYDFSGVDAAKNAKDLYGLRYSDFVVPLVKAVQELSQQNDSLKKSNVQQSAINTGLQNQINDLRAIMEQMQSCSPCTRPSSSANTQQISMTAPGNENDKAALAQNIPNPFRGSTTIGYTLPSNYSSAQIIIRDNYGRILNAVNVSGHGDGSVAVNIPAIANGVYNYSLLVDGRLIDTKKMISAK